MGYVPPENYTATRRTLHVLGMSALTAALTASAALADDAAPTVPGPTAPAFTLTAAASTSAAYVSNASGLSNGSSDDFVLTLGFSAGVHDHTRRFIFDAQYAFTSDFYAKGTQPTHFTNNLQALGTVIAIPDYLTFTARAFANPVVVSNAGIVTAGNRVVSNGYSNSYGYSVGPDLRFRLDDFLVSETSGVYGGTYFSRPAGSAPVVIIPGVPGPQDTTYREASQVFTSGDDFERFNWTITGVFSETDNKQGLLSEKLGTFAPRFSINHEFALLGTVGYNALTATIPLNRNVSGLVVLGGFQYVPSKDFSLVFEAGHNFGGGSYIGSLRYDLTPKSSIVGQLNDYVTTPEGQLFDSLSSLTATPGGDLTTPGNQLGNGSPGSLSTFSAQPIGNFGFDQNISRYQIATLSYMEDLDRNHASLMLYASRRTILSGVFLGPPITDTWGGQLSFARSFSPLSTGTVSARYSVDQELGGIARTFTLDANVSYAMSRRMSAYFDANYIDRQSSASLAGVSPFSGSLSDYRIMVGISRTILP